MLLVAAFLLSLLVDVVMVVLSSQSEILPVTCSSSSLLSLLPLHDDRNANTRALLLEVSLNAGGTLLAAVAPGPNKRPLDL